MSRYPSAQWRPIRDTSTVKVRKDIFCLHTIVGGMRSCWSYFDRLDVQVYSQLLLGGPWGSDAGHDLDGVAWQIADTDYRGASNLDGNWRVIACETADNGVRPIQPWTDPMCGTIVRLMADAHRLDGIPLQLIPDTLPGRRGIGYHRLGCDPYRVAGGERWSKAYGKDCPTDPRIRQIPDLIIDARRLVAGTPTPEDLSIVDADTKKYLDQQFAKLNGGFNTVIYGDERVDTKPDTHPENLQRIRQEFRQEIGAVHEKLDKLLAAQAPPDPTQGS